MNGLKYSVNWHENSSIGAQGDWMDFIFNTYKIECLIRLRIRLLQKLIIKDYFFRQSSKNKRDKQSSFIESFSEKYAQKNYLSRKREEDVKIGKKSNKIFIFTHFCRNIHIEIMIELYLNFPTFSLAPSVIDISIYSIFKVK